MGNPQCPPREEPSIGSGFRWQGLPDFHGLNREEVSSKFCPLTIEQWSQARKPDIHNRE
jgi:hypothetical protein